MALQCAGVTAPGQSWKGESNLEWCLLPNTQRNKGQTEICGLLTGHDGEEMDG